MDRIFFFLYNWYLNKSIVGIKRSTDDAIGLASWMMGVGTGLWFFLVDEISSYFFHYDVDKYHLVLLISSGLIVSGLFHSHYLIKDRTAKINKKYECSLNKKNIRTGALFSFLFIFSPLLILAIWVILINKHLE